MNAGNLLSSLAKVAANALSPLAVAIRQVFRPLLRFGRLVSLRSQAGGPIPVTTQFDGPVSACGAGLLSIGENCRLGRHVHFDTGDAGTITLGQRVRINSGGVIVANGRVSIGDDTLIGEYVTIRDANHGVADDALIRLQTLVWAEVKIGRDVWIGRGACILKGVTVGDGAVVGANSVVTHDLPPGAICVGVPARQIGRRSIGHLAPESSVASAPIGGDRLS